MLSLLDEQRVEGPVVLDEVVFDILISLLLRSEVLLMEEVQNSIHRNQYVDYPDTESHDGNPLNP